MNWRALRTIALKDLKEVRQNRAAWLPGLVMPILMVVVLPLALIIIFQQAGPPPNAVSQSGPPLSAAGQIPFLPADDPRAQLAGLNTTQTLVVVATGYFLAPLMLILPLMFASIVGADAFAGEKERKSLEALLYTPATDSELLLGKVLASVVPAIGLAWLSFAVYTAVVNTASWSLMGRIWFPLPAWWPLMLWLAPAIATLGMATSVLISSRVSSFMEANQLGGSVVLVVLAFFAGQVSGVLYLGVTTTLVVGAIVWLIDAVLLWFGVRTFRREALIAKL